ncbi:DUF2917 domain-containing protein [Ramlibacter sp. AN1015]|uniref:DUF2917 domain-containing protein n=1 Tax=Ramlibacter sp. AN1015 TaxID=3133428 RepID=UPI0030C64184
MHAQKPPFTHQSSDCAGAWKLAARDAVSLRPREASLLRVVQGRVWLTIDTGGAAPVCDHVLVAGEEFRIPAGSHAVMEAWKAQPVCFAWEPVPEVAVARAARREAVLRPLADLRQAGALAGGALVRLAAGLAAWGWAVVAGRDNGGALLSKRWLAPDHSSTMSSATKSWT